MRPSLNSDPLSERLALSGLRSTPQRVVVYRVLVTQRDHPTADEVYARVRKQLPSISLATVYNCLEALVQCEVVRTVNIERGPTRYCPNLQPHAHFIDEDSGEAHDVELPAAVLDHVKSVLPAGMAASSVEIIFRGKTAAPKPAASPGPKPAC